MAYSRSLLVPGPIGNVTRTVYGAFTGSTVLIKFSTGTRTLYTLASAMTAGASDVAKAVNTLLSFSDDDQYALLEVIQGYFCLPEDGTDQDDDDDGETTLEGTEQRK